MLIKQKTLLLTRNLAPRTFGELFKVFQTKTNLLYLLYSTAPRCCLLHLIKRNCVLKNFLRTLIIITQVIIITRVLPSIQYFFNSQEEKKFITNFDLSKVSGSDWRPVVVLKNCEPDLSFIRADRFNKCLKESCFPDCRKVSLVVPVFKNVGGKVYSQKLPPCQSSFCGQ